MSVSDRVRRGIALLDEEMPGWPDQVDVLTLDMASGYRCVIGQTHGGYIDGLDKLDIDELPEDYGFDCDAGRHEYHTLDRLWTYAINARRAR
jgi:hypothetical protein